MTLVVQSVRISKRLSKKEADQVAKKMKIKLNVKPNPQYKNFHAYRQIQPEKFKKGSYRMKKLNKDVMLVLGELKA